MDHIQFKANQTAAGYVANGLDESTQEAFELHLMGCSECVEDVEVWRAIKLDMPRQRPEVRSKAPKPRFVAFSDWRMAASLVGAGIIGATGGWLENPRRPRTWTRHERWYSTSLPCPAVQTTAPQSGLRQTRNWRSSVCRGYHEIFM